MAEITKELLLQLHATMLRIRLFEERASDLLEAGKIKCPCHLYIGQEAVATGVCAVLNKADTAWGTHRSHGHYLAKGGDMNTMMAELLGKASGCAKGRGGSMHVFAAEVGILGTVRIGGATIPIAVGAALAGKLRLDNAVAVSFFGDGATEEGHFHESLNLASLYRLPIVFVCENNLYSSHLRIDQRRRLDNINEMAHPYGMPGIRLNGNDVAAVHAAAGDAVARARAGKGPTLLECRTYRFRGHVGPAWDMDVGVRRRGELAEWLLKCPIVRARRQLVSMGVGEDQLDQTARDIGAEVDAAEAFAEQSEWPPDSELLDHATVDGRRES